MLCLLLYHFLILGDLSLLLHKVGRNKRQLNYANDKNLYSEEWQIFLYFIAFF